VALSALSGCVWAVIASFVGKDINGLEGGLYASPVIGVIVGLLFQGFSRHSPLGRAILSLLGFYLAVTLFGLAIGITDFATGLQSGPGWSRKPVETVLQAIIGSLWGVTFLGWVLLLWPLAYLNFLIVEREVT